MGLIRKRGRPNSSQVTLRDEEILDTAFALFNSNSFHQVSLATIGEQSKVAVRTIYLSFGGKLGVVKALVARAAARHAKQIAALALPMDCESSLHLLGSHLLLRARDQDFLKLQLIVISTGDSDISRQCYQAGPGQLLGVIKAEVKRAQEGGVLDAVFTNEELCELFISVIVGPQLGRYVMPPEAVNSGISRLPKKQAAEKFLQLTKKRTIFVS